MGWIRITKGILSALELRNERSRGDRLFEVLARVSPARTRDVDPEAFWGRDKHL